MRRLLTLLAATSTLLLVLAGAALADAEVSITDSGLDPASVDVDVREPIVWTNTTDADVALVGEDPEWESGPIAPGDTFSIEITQPGTYAYASEDGSLEGEIVVGGGDEGATEAPGDGGDGGDDAEVVEEPEDGAGGRGGGDEEPPLPKTGIETTLPAVLSVLLIMFGAGLLRVTEPIRRPL